MSPEKEVTPLDKEALLLLPGLRYARSIIEFAMQVSRHSAQREGVKRPSNDPRSAKKP
jgi:hypothetical protein